MYALFDYIFLVKTTGYEALQKQTVQQYVGVNQEMA